MAPFATFRAFALGVALACWNSTAASADTVVDLELVLAVDVSLSMDLDEQKLQRDGYVAAFRDPQVQKAIASGPHGKIAVTYLEWAGPASQQVVLPWTLLDSPAAIEEFADKLVAIPVSRARMTSISEALAFSARQFDSNTLRGVRRVIDVSGDGPNNSGRPVEGVRDELIGNGIIINGLPILLKAYPTGFFDVPDLDVYYSECVIGGTGSFVIPIRQKPEFATAIRQKLLLEISGHEPPARLIRTQVRPAEPRADCFIGEKQWRRYIDGQFRQ